MKQSNSTEIEHSIKTALEMVQNAYFKAPRFSLEEKELRVIFRSLIAAMDDFNLYFGEKGDRQ